MSIEAFNRATGELAQTGQPAPFAPNDRSRSLVDYVAELEAAQQLGAWLCQSMLAPPHLKGKPGEAAAVILMGDTLGLDPINAMTGVYAVHNTPALYARTMVALVQAAGHYIERTEATEQRVTWEARRRGGKTTRTFTWDMARARTAGYTNNKKYQTDPIGMLSAKASAEACRVMFADVLMGMASVEEVELGDYDVVDVTEVPNTPEPKANVTKIKRKPAKAPEPTPPPAIHDAPAPTEDDEQDDDGPALVFASRSQQSRLGKALDAIGVTENQDKATEVQRWAKEQKIDRDVQKSGELTVDEIENMITWLESMTADAPAAEWDTAEVPS